MVKQETHKGALQSADARLDFYSHLTVFVLINLMLFGLNVIITPSILWFIYPLAGWGIGLVIHGLVVFAHYRQKGASDRIEAS
ncbi:MAG TPA: 2TM domain-containing protein [Pyrinomonadaceae bacterium]|nr:2TM domain-containing protein [Pyrinomonadaceae bacterium]